MATAPSPATRSRRQSRRVEPPPRWRRWLLLGLFFGLGYGMTQRLLEVRWGGESNKPPAFRAKSPKGGSSLEELRRRNGNRSQPLTADLETLARLKRERQEKQEAAKKEESERQRAAEQQKEDSGEDRRRRLDDLSNPQEPIGGDPTGQGDSPTMNPVAPELPPPVPFAGQAPESPPSAGQSTPGEGAPTPP